MADQTWGLRCRCGSELVGRGERGLLGVVRAHLDEQHPRLVGAYSDDDVLSLAYRRPAAPTR